MKIGERLALTSRTSSRRSAFGPGKVASCGSTVRRAKSSNSQCRATKAAAAHVVLPGVLELLVQHVQGGLHVADQDPLREPLPVGGPGALVAVQRRAALRSAPRRRLLRQDEVNDVVGIAGGVPLPLRGRDHVVGRGDVLPRAAGGCSELHEMGRSRACPKEPSPRRGQKVGGPIFTTSFLGATAR